MIEDNNDVMQSDEDQAGAIDQVVDAGVLAVCKP